MGFELIFNFLDVKVNTMQEDVVSYNDLDFEDFEDDFAPVERKI